jgi:hypothetical protein
LYIILELGVPVSRILRTSSKVAARFYKNKAITAEVRPCTCVPIMTPIKDLPGIMNNKTTYSI